MPPCRVKIAAFKGSTCRLAIKHRKQVPPRPEMIRRAQFLYLRVEFLPRQLPFKPSNPFLSRFFHCNYFRAAIRTRKTFFAIVEYLFPACLTSHFAVFLSLRPLRSFRLKLKRSDPDSRGQAAQSPMRIRLKHVNRQGRRRYPTQAHPPRARPHWQSGVR